MDSRRYYLGLVILGVWFVAGCGGRGTPPDVPTGRFVAHIDGTISDTLEGAAHYRTANASIVGLELGAPDAGGLSMELEPRLPALRTYEVVDWELFNLERAGDGPGIVAFLHVDGAQFSATSGTLEVTYVEDDQIGATFSMEMEGTFDDGPETSPSVRVEGTVNAPPEP